MMPDIAVLTGDLIGSTEAGGDALGTAMAELAAAAADLAGWGGGPARFTRFRGDGWQMVLDDPALALRAALVLFARLRARPGALPTRIAIGIGPAESLGTADLSDARGAGFERSGRALDAMGRTHRLALDAKGLTLLHPVVADLLESHARRWTAEQAAAAALALHPGNPTLTDIAPRLGITPQAVNYRLTGGSVQAIRRALAGWEEAFETFAITGRWNA